MAGLLAAWRNWQERRSIMREFGSLHAMEHEWDVHKIKNILTEAQAAVAIDDYQRSAELWDEAIALNKQAAHKSSLALPVLLRLQRFDAAESIMLELQAKHPANSDYAVGLIRVALAKRDFDAAIRHAAFVRKRFPRTIDGYARGLDALRGANRLQDAEALAIEGIKAFPDNIHLLIEHAKIAEVGEDWKAALERWTVVLERFGHASGYPGVGSALVKSGRYAEADEVLEKGRMRFPSEPTIAVAWARSAQASGNDGEAIARWQRAADRFPLEAHVIFAATSALEQLGALSDAEAVLQEATERIRHEPALLIRMGNLQLRRRDFTAATETFARLRDAFPQREEGYSLGAEAAARAGQPREADTLRNAFRSRTNASAPGLHPV
ncbi:MAG: hypothetical protein JSS43_16935 [Proteobacteria bacterium]|nr:hypothetical protein [Pseudomonadota bacterium]